jgi:hypothetical protein
MALIKCKECGHDLSDNAPKCLHCGAKHTTKSTKRILWMFFGTFVFITVFNAGTKNNQTINNPKNVTTSTPLPLPSQTPPKLPLNEIEKKAILKPFTRNHDKIERTTWYKNQVDNTEYSSRIYTYLGEKDGGYWMRFVIRYSASSWIFLESIKFLIDDERIDFNLNRFNVKRNNSSATIWESYDAPVGNKELAFLTMIGNSKNAEMRFVGSKRSTDRKITNSEKKGIQIMVEAYIKLRQ